jgi:DNA-binding response OmpR family regulator
MFVLLVQPRMIDNKKLILVVDDEESVRNSLRAILENAGYRVVTAENGQKAIEKALVIPFDAVLVDLNLPDIDGADLILRLPKKDHEMIKIVITGFSTPEEGAKAADCGADDFLVKPVQPKELLNTLETTLAQL